MLRLIGVFTVCQLPFCVFPDLHGLMLYVMAEQRRKMALMSDASIEGLDQPAQSDQDSVCSSVNNQTRLSKHLREGHKPVA